jgi:hypothetical protein
MAWPPQLQLQLCSEPRPARLHPRTAPWRIAAQAHSSPTVHQQLLLPSSPAVHLSWMESLFLYVCPSSWGQQVSGGQGGCCSFKQAQACAASQARQMRPKEVVQMVAGSRHVQLALPMAKSSCSLAGDKLAQAALGWGQLHAAHMEPMQHAACSMPTTRPGHLGRPSSEPRFTPFQAVARDV